MRSNCIRIWDEMTIESFNEKVVRIQQEGPTTTKTLWALQPPKPYVGGIDLSMLSCLSILFFLLYYYFASCLCQNSNLNSIIQIIFIKTVQDQRAPHPKSSFFLFDFFCSYSQALVWPFWLLPLQTYLSTIIGDRVSPQKRRYPFVYLSWRMWKSD